MLYELLDNLEKKHPILYVILMLSIFVLGAAAIWGLGVFAHWIASIKWF